MESRAGRILWTILALVLGAVVVLAAVFGPGLYRKGRSVVGPIVELTKIEDEAEALDLEFPFEAAEDQEMNSARVETFLHIREQLAPQYEKWAAAERRVEQQGESWESAADILGVVRGVMQAQNDLLRSESMSPKEFRWHERRIYDTWLVALENGGSGDPEIVRQRLAETTREDLRAVEEIRGKHGGGKALNAVEQRLQERLSSLELHGPPRIDGFTEAECSVLWQHLERISTLRFEQHQDAHAHLRREEGGTRVVIGEED